MELRNFVANGAETLQNILRLNSTLSAIQSQRDCLCEHFRFVSDDSDNVTGSRKKSSCASPCTRISSQSELRIYSLVRGMISTVLSQTELFVNIICSRHGTCLNLDCIHFVYEALNLQKT
jgi:hypothetical protein